MPTGVIRLVLDAFYAVGNAELACGVETCNRSVGSLYVVYLQPLPGDGDFSFGIRCNGVECAV